MRVIHRITKATSDAKELMELLDLYGELQKMNDWRLTNQHEYLDHAILIWDRYPDYASDDHAHCEFYFLKFPYETKMGYRTRDFKHWVCKECFEDFKNEFDWTVSDE